MNKLRKLSGVLLLSLLAAGCATTRSGSSVDSQRTADPDVLTQWTAKGRIALVAQGEGGSGSFVWQQRSERTELQVRGPLGAGGLQVVTDGETLELTDGSGQPLDGDAARAALESRLGVKLPLAELRYWMLGIPAPENSGGQVQMATGATPGFVQGGWVVSYDAVAAQSGWRLPARLNATTTGGTRVRIVVDDWVLPAP